MKNQWAKLGGVLGIVYCIAGFVLIFLGWNGAASNDSVEAQMPYLVSGGIAGLGLVIIGAALIVAYSLRTDRAELKTAIDELRSSGVVGAAAVAAPVVASGQPVSGGVEVVAGEQSYHRADCTMVAGQHAARPMSAAEAAAAGLEPCRICQPDQLVA
jgi:hypothetical protein